MDQLDRLVIALRAIERAVVQGQESGAVIPALATQCHVPPETLAWAWGVTEQRTRERAADALANAMRAR